MATILRQLAVSVRSFNFTVESPPPSSPSPPHLHPAKWRSRIYVTSYGARTVNAPCDLRRRNHSSVVAMSSPTPGIVTSTDDEDDGVSLGTMKLPGNTDLQRFETLLFQWANSLSQGANVPLPMPLKVDKIPGGARLGFITIGDGETEVLVYIDCLVFPATAESAVPIFRAVRNGKRKDQPPPGEPRIMRSLLQALKKSVEIATL